MNFQEANLNRINVFYTPKMSADSKSYSPSSAKPTLAVASWREKFHINIIDPKPATVIQFSRAHDPGYVRDILSCRRANGFGNSSRQVAETLRYTSGAMLDATSNAIESGGFACAPVSGFHHACWDHGGGFCTFNGLMVAALDLLEQKRVSRIGILDCDMHYGNGTDDILAHLGESRIVHYSAGLFKGTARQFLEELPYLMKTLFQDCGVLLYQAGADPHINDPLGGWMTTEELLVRDTIVFKMAIAMGLPVSWCLAGGYQRDASGGIAPVLTLHDNTMRACLEQLRLASNPSITPVLIQV